MSLSNLRLKRRSFVASAALTFGAALALSGCGGADDTPTYRYRLTLEVDTPEGLKTGSSVIEVETDVAGDYAIATPGRVSHELRGEAVTVDLGDGRVLFALLRSNSDSDWASRVMFMLAPAYAGEGAFQNRFDAMLRKRAEMALPRYFPRAGHLDARSAYPMLVTFGDLSDPTSVEQVDPDDLAATFGEGVRLERITVQMTDDPVTTGIEERLGWLGKIREMNLEREDFPSDIPVGDFSGMFKKETIR